MLILNAVGLQIRPSGESAVGDPSKKNNLVSNSQGKIDFHSHASGTKPTGVPNQSYAWQQPPTKHDIITAIGDEYVIGMGSGLIYKYNKKGVFATIPLKTFK